MAAFISGTVAFIRAVPILDKWFQGIVGAYYKLRVSEIKDLEITEDNERDAIINSIQKADNDAERIALSIVLHKHNSGELSEQNRG